MKIFLQYWSISYSIYLRGTINLKPYVRKRRATIVQRDGIPKQRAETQPGYLKRVPIWRRPFPRDSVPILWCISYACPASCNTHVGSEWQVWDVTSGWAKRAAKPQITRSVFKKDPIPSGQSGLLLRSLYGE